MTKKTTTIIAAFATLIALSAPALANEPTSPGLTKSATGPVLDIEIDPIAYALSGYSVHGGLSWNHVRLDVGVFGLTMPESMHGVEGVEIKGGGYGAKLDYYPLRRAPGLFFGGQVSRFREQARDKMSGLETAASHTTFGARVGYRFNITRGFYVLPWIGVDVSVSDRTQTVAGKEYKPGRVMFFPTVHFGKRF